MRCPRCGNENSDTNRFCGMCGASLLATPVSTPAPPQPVSVVAPKPVATEVTATPAPPPEPRRAATAVSETPASISGPSFLGLNEPASAPRSARKRASLSIDPESAPGSSLDYLLDEEEPPHSWGIGKILLILIALALAVGFGYLRFKNQGLAWLSGLKKPAAAVAQNSTTTDNSTPSTPSITPDPQPTAAQAPTPSALAPAPNSTPAAAVTPAPVPANPSTTASPITSAPDSANAGDKPKSTDAAPAPVASDKAAPPKDSDSTAENDSVDAPTAATKPVEKPAPAPKAPAPKPSPSKLPTDSVLEAQKYLYGRGASQDCDRGLRLLKPEANRSNPKAMIEMGALYSAGLCTPRDLPTAYRWFALALRKDPENTSVQADLSKLWGEMTQPERQLAIKMTQ